MFSMFQPCWGVVEGPTGNRYGELASLVKYYYHYYYYYYCCCFSAFFFLSLLFFLSFLGYFSVKVPFSLIWGLMADLPGFTSRWGIIQSRREVLKVEVPGHTISLLPIFMEPCTYELKYLRLERKHLHVVLFFSVYSDESETNTESARFEVFRNKGTFGVISVSWNITASNGGDPASDVSPVSGHVTFSAGENSKFITIESLPDNVSALFQTYLCTSLLEPFSIDCRK